MIDLKTNQNISANKGGQPDYVSISHLQMKAGKNARVVIDILSGQSCYIRPYYGGSGTFRRAVSIDSEIDNNMVFFPNPCRDFLIFQFNEKSQNPYRLVMYDDLGRLVTSEPFSVLLSQFILDMSSYPTGVYLFILYTDDDIIIAHEKVIKTE